MVGPRAGINVKILAVWAHDEAVVEMIENSGLRAWIWLRLREQRPCPRGTAGNPFHDTSKRHGAVRRDVSDNIDRSVWADGQTFNTAREPMISSTVGAKDRCRRSAGRLQVHAKNVAVDLEIPELVIPRIFRDPDRIGASAVRGINDETDLKVCVQQNRGASAARRRGYKEGNDSR